ncbi:branched-chain amino acid transport system II carrier protein BrnQ2 [Bacillus pseudomycoides]|uniref:branched-chain amino acid transport system II carrier protein BrnQ2 n=1 Tax=Bacillus pseudomycoides TaxID=64104 RepID=UPI000BF04CCE|nr:branched-chain amino acid transport system II carrier protein [Bacillus pseudomycoides]PEI98606.1 branched-chain amino acid transport system II carrier protein [Bacillus pseudomycoides]PEM67987.1 branched-chain amino acid transport system II carrier protein [Bacillus pseudomycoides]PGA64021.1 branched-chain amino acid transport system II carrier protein [Bacillus pseudomycoides]PHA53529.1 branched-chain amino acid transport system II carrier protein [Bacillus pseudomycoides]PHA65429.1 branc
MRTTLKPSQILSISLLLFAVFFGAGNMIFPPLLGLSSGENMWVSISGFIITDVGLSLLAIVAVALAGGNFKSLASRVHPKFAAVLAIIIYLSIGPLFVIPRTGSVSYEIGIAPLFQDQWYSMLLFSFIFFTVVYFLSLNPSKLVDHIGKILTPILLGIIAVMATKVILSPTGLFVPPVGDYKEIPFFKGFLEGFLTLDAIGALVLSTIVVNAIRQNGVKEQASIAKYTIICGSIAAFFLTVVYFLLGYIGASNGNLGQFENGGQLLATVMYQLFGTSGNILLSVAIIFACLTTAIGVVSAFANYFTTVLTNVSYKKLVFYVCIFSFIVSNLGLSLLIKITLPVLIILYPITIILIFVSFIDKYTKRKPSVYIGAMIAAFIISCIHALDNIGMMPAAITSIASTIPLYKLGIGWIVPAIIGGIVGYFIPQAQTEGEISTK